VLTGSTGVGHFVVVTYEFERYTTRDRLGCALRASNRLRTVLPIDEWLIVNALQNRVGALAGRLITDFDDLRQLSGAWDKLWQANPNRSIFGKFSWIDSWWRGYGGNVQLLTPIIFEGGTCVGILPLYVEGSELRFLGDPASDYNDLICDPGREADVLGAAIEQLDRSQFPWKFCQLNNCSESSLIVAARADLPPSVRNRTQSFVSALCPTVMLDNGRAETLKTILAKNTVIRRIKQLQKLGSLTFRHLDDRVQAREHLPSLFQQHIRCRALAGIRSHLIERESQEFFSALVDNLDAQSELRFSVLELDGRPLAYNFGFQLDGKFLYYNPTFDIDFFDLSPGEVLLRYLFLYAQERDVREFDFTVGEESYKIRYANHSRNNYTIVLYPATAPGQLRHAALAFKERLRSYPAGYKTAKSVASALRAFLDRIVRVVRRDGLVPIAKTSAVRLFRSAIYSRDEVLVFTLKRPETATETRGLTFREATLSDLADAVVTFPEYLGRDTLHDLRDRLKKGHKAFIVVDNGKVVHIVWTRVDDRLATLELGEDFAFEFGRPTGIMYDARTPLAARGKGVYPIALSLLAQHVAESGLEPIGFVQTDNAPSKRGSEKLGMVVRGRMIRSVWFHWIRRCVVQKEPPA